MRQQAGEAPEREDGEQPGRHLNEAVERARERRDLVLEVMAEQGLINQEQAVVAQAMPLSVGGARRIDSYPAYLDLVRRHLKEQYRKRITRRRACEFLHPLTLVCRISWSAARLAL